MAVPPPSLTIKKIATGATKSLWREWRNGEEKKNQDTMNKAEISSEEWYESLVEECKAIITEAIFTSRWALVEGYWNLGKRIREDSKVKEYAKGSKTFVQDLARNLSISERTLYYALNAYDKYPKLEGMPEGKNLTWNKLITEYLPAPKENKIEISLPKGKYGLIVIDPPWAYGTEYNKESRRVGSPYKELSTEELKKIEIPGADDSVLWLWTTHKFLWDAKMLVDHWGYEYKLAMVWNKVRMGMGAWLRCQVEFCLLGIKGNPEWKLTNQRDILTDNRKEHSRKPNSFYKTIEELTPSKKRIDMFGREKRDGWDIWGNEPHKF